MNRGELVVTALAQPPAERLSLRASWIFFFFYAHNAKPKILQLGLPLQQLNSRAGARLAVRLPQTPQLLRRSNHRDKTYQTAKGRARFFSAPRNGVCSDRYDYYLQTQRIRALPPPPPPPPYLDVSSPSLLSFRLTSPVGGLGSHRSRGGAVPMNARWRLSRAGAQLKASQVYAGSSDRSLCHVGISPARTAASCNDQCAAHCACALCEAMCVRA